MKIPVNIAINWERIAFGGLDDNIICVMIHQEAKHISLGNGNLSIKGLLTTYWNDPPSKCPHVACYPRETLGLAQKMLYAP